MANMYHIVPFKGGPRRGEKNFVEGPDFESWMRLILAYCRLNNISDSKDIINIAMMNIDPESGDAYETVYCLPGLLWENNHIEWFKKMRARFNADAFSAKHMMMLCVDMMALEKRSDERFVDFVNRVGRIECKMRVARSQCTNIPKEAITMFAEAALMGSLPRECLKDVNWTRDLSKGNSTELYERATHRLAYRDNPDYVTMKNLSKNAAEKAILLSRRAYMNYENKQDYSNIRDNQTNKNRGNGNGDGKSSQIVMCFSCGRTGHKKYQCYKHLDKIKKRCLRCKRSGHSKADCRQQNNNS